METMKALKVGTNVNPVSGEKSVELTGLSRLISSPSDAWQERKVLDTDGNPTGEVRRTRIATVSAPIPLANGKVHMQNVTVSIHENTLKAVAKVPYVENEDGKRIYDDFSEDHSLEDALEHFEVGEDFLTTLRVTTSTRPEDNGKPLFLGNISHLKTELVGIEGNFLDTTMDFAFSLEPIEA